MAELERVKGKGLPPVHLWHPDVVTKIDMRVHADGTWYYMGSPIERRRLVRLFSTVLRREGEQYFLVTPVEKCLIEVEDAPFQAVLLEVMGQGKSQQLKFTTNMAEEVIVDADHPLRFEIDSATGEPSPYVLVRDSLEARLNRSVYYHLAELVVSDIPSFESKSKWLGVWSSAIFFPIQPNES